MIRPVLKQANDPKAEGYVRFVCISDTHGVYKGLHLPPGDVLLHSGDFTKRGTPEQVQEFSSFLSTLPYSHIVVIAGNHELTFDTAHFPSIKSGFDLFQDVESEPTKALLTNCTYLEDSGTTHYGYRIWGSPWQPRFGNWAFNLGPEIAEKWALIPSDTDILLTHAPPRSVQDCNERGEMQGCPLLFDRVRDIKPLVHLFGHIHEGYGVQQLDSTLFINGAVTNKWRQLANAPVVFDLPDKS